ncbi:MAG: hypothetical protein IPL79_13185 [Myxococcales bacterium]|nr:hypothetical protein [Myxococcales bacterium]
MSDASQEHAHADAHAGQPPRAGWRRWLRRLGVLALVGAALALVTAFTIDRAFGTDVYLLTPAPAEAVAANRLLWLPGDPVADIYGTISDQKIRVAFADKENIVVPKEDPTLRLYPVSAQAGEHALQTKSVWFIAWRAAAGAALAGALLLLLAWWPRKKSTAQPHAHA